MPATQHCNPIPSSHLCLTHTGCPTLPPWITPAVHAATPVTDPSCPAPPRPPPTAPPQRCSRSVVPGPWLFLFNRCSRCGLLNDAGGTVGHGRFVVLDQRCHTRGVTIRGNLTQAVGGQTWTRDIGSVHTYTIVFATTPPVLMSLSSLQRIYLLFANGSLLLRANPICGC